MLFPSSTSLSRSVTRRSAYISECSLVLDWSGSIHLMVGSSNDVLEGAMSCTKSSGAETDIHLVPQGCDITRQGWSGRLSVRKRSR
jgi:hypothetical protein